MPPNLSRLPGDPVAMIGHNQGPPLDPGRSWRRHCWGAARKALTPHLPIEVIRRRVIRARELGLDYPAYAAILLGSGRDIAAFLFTAEAIGLRLRRAHALPEGTAARLRALKDCQRLLLVEAGSDPQAAAAALAAAAAPVRAAGAAPATHGQAEGRAAIRAILDPLKLPADAVVMVGAQPVERDWAAAARLARFVAAPIYFGAAPP